MLNSFMLPSELLVNTTASIAKRKPENIKTHPISMDGSCYWVDNGRPFIYLANGGVKLVGLVYNCFHMSLTFIVARRSWEDKTTKTVIIDLTHEVMEEFTDMQASQIYTMLVEELLCDKLNLDHASVQNTINIEEFEHALRSNVSFRLGNDMHSIVTF